MDQATLVEKDVALAGRVLDALSWTKVPVTFCDWYYVPELEEWQLVIATPWYDTKGPLAAWRALVDALQKAGTYEQVPTRRIFIKSPSDPLVRSLQLEAKEQSHGFLHIIKDKKAAKWPSFGSHRPKYGQTGYSVIFAPVAGRGGVVPARRFSDRGELESFLVNRLQLRQGAVTDALIEVDQHGHSSIFPVQLSVRELKKIGLAQT